MPAKGVGPGFGSDVGVLGLALQGVPQQVVHLAAANEHRKNFSLTDIVSSLNAGTAVRDGCCGRCFYFWLPQPRARP